MASVTFQDLIDSFVAGENDGFTGTDSKRGNLWLKDGKLFHFDTLIAQRANDSFILNVSRYSIQTSLVQKKLRETIPVERIIIARKVPASFCGDLKDYT